MISPRFTHLRSRLPIRDGLIALILMSYAHGEEKAAPFGETRSEVYKTIGDVTLKIHLYEPEGHQPTDKVPAIVFFFGGGWQNGTPGQFQKQCEYLAGRGMIAATADYRVGSRHGVKAVSCVRDAQSAVRWLRKNAARLGIDPDRIVAGGGSAGGHLAACTGVLSQTKDDGSGDDGPSSQPNALALFNPAVMLANFEGAEPFAGERNKSLKERFGASPAGISPIHHVRPGLPPAIIFHGRDDTVVTYRTVERFTEEMKKAGNRCELHGYTGEVHGFFNWGRGKNIMFGKTMTSLDSFLVSLGYLKGEPTVQDFVIRQNSASTGKSGAAVPDRERR